MRFAFYGRVSTEDQQDPESSRNWQLARAHQLIEPAGGEIVEEFFDIGQSRSLPWKRRPEASRLLDTFSGPIRGFDGVVIGATRIPLVHEGDALIHVARFDDYEEAHGHVEAFSDLYADDPGDPEAQRTPPGEG